jgi:hypothetical protein
MQPGEVVIRCADGEERALQAANVFWTAGVRALTDGQISVETITRRRLPAWVVAAAAVQSVRTKAVSDVV